MSDNANDMETAVAPQSKLLVLQTNNHEAQQTDIQEDANNEEAEQKAKTEKTEKGNWGRFMRLRGPDGADAAILKSNVGIALTEHLISFVGADTDHLLQTEGLLLIKALNIRHIASCVPADNNDLSRCTTLKDVISFTEAQMVSLKNQSNCSTMLSGILTKAPSGGHAAQALPFGGRVLSALDVAKCN